jgi:hypothetical protein
MVRGDCGVVAWWAWWSVVGVVGVVAWWHGGRGGRVAWWAWWPGGVVGVVAWWRGGRGGVVGMASMVVTLGHPPAMPFALTGVGATGSKTMYAARPVPHATHSWSLFAWVGTQQFKN